MVEGTPPVIIPHHLDQSEGGFQDSTSDHRNLPFLSKTAYGTEV